MNPFQTNTVQPQNRFTPSMFMTPQGNVYVICAIPSESFYGIS